MSLNERTNERTNERNGQDKSALHDDCIGEPTVSFKACSKCDACRQQWTQGIADHIAP
jgi:hypothetical protein